MFHQFQETRLIFFLLGFILFFALEIKFPIQKEKKNFVRFSRNLVLGFISALSVAYTIAHLHIQDTLFPYKNISLPLIYFIVYFIVFDAATYFIHRLFHLNPLLWKIHQVHHLDQSIDISTGLRFHAFEALLSMGIHIAIAWVFGIPFWMIVSAQALLNFFAMFSHSNVSIPSNIESLIKIFIITPRLHRVHHSVLASQSQKNYGFFLNLWDRIFDSYEESDHTSNLSFGIKEYKNQAQKQNFFSLLLWPVKITQDAPKK